MLLCSTQVVSEEQRLADQVQLKYDIGSTYGWIPFGYSGDQARPGILVELVMLIMDEANISIRSSSMPPKRAVYALEQGELDFDIISPSWFKNGDIGNKYVKSIPILTVTEHFITLAENEKNYQSLKQVYGTRVGTVAGYAYFDDDKFTRSDFRSESELMLGLKKQRFEVAIMERLAALHWSKIHNVAISFPLEHTTGEIVLRLRREHQALLPRINTAIGQLQEKGIVKQTMAKYQP